MRATVPQLGARALRKLGIAIVADAARPAAGATLTQADVVARVMRNAGILVPADQRPAPGAPVGLAELGARLLRSLGINPIAGVAATSAVISQQEAASHALRLLGVNPGDLTAGIGSGLTYTLDQIATATLRKLAVVASDETPETTDQADALARVTDVHDALVRLDYVTWPGTAIPASAAEHYIIMAANLLAPLFGKSASLEIYAAAQEALRILALSGSIAQARAETKISAVHQALVAEALADWPVTSIPESVAEAYAAMAAVLMAPVHGKTAPEGAYAAGMAQVRRVVLSGPRGQAIAETKIAAAHEALNALGLVSWPVSAVPLAHTEDYVTMGARLMAPVLGREGPPEAEWDTAVARIRRAGEVSDATARATQKLASVQSELNAMGVAAWQADQIPAAMADALADMVAIKMGPSEDLKALGARFDVIRAIAMGGPAGQALAEQKVRAVHATLEARGKTRWTIYDIPLAAEEPYVFMAAVLLAPECDRKAGDGWWQSAEADLARIVSLPSARRPVMASYF